MQLDSMTCSWYDDRMKKSRSTVTLAVPMGDPSGIGPEIILKALSEGKIAKQINLVVVGDEQVFSFTAIHCDLPFSYSSVVTDDASLEAALDAGHTRILYSLNDIDMSSFRFGAVQAQCGKAAYESVATAVRLVMSGLCDAVVTAPLHKEALKAAGVDHIGYTEIIASLTNSENPVTMFDTLGLKVFFHSRHLSLRSACDAVTEESLYHTIMSCDAITRENPGFDLSLPLAVAGLNPHCGEHGLFGNEEQTAIVPAIERARKDGVDVIGPIGADSVFHQGKLGRFRAVISLYHDQGHIACKTLDFEKTISVTWNLPLLRTSVDHGTAFDIAGTGNASAVSMVEAIEVARKYLQG